MPTLSGDILGPAPLVASRFRSTSESTYSVDMVFVFPITKADYIEEAVVHMGMVIRRLRPTPFSVVSGDTYTLTYTMNGHFDDEDPAMPPPRASVKRLLKRLNWTGKITSRKSA